VDFHFIAADAGKPRSLEQISNGGKPEVFEPVTAFVPAAAQMAEFAGDYVCDEIDPVYRIVLADGKLSLSRLKHQPDPLRPVMLDTLTGDVGTLHFTRDAGGRISGFVLNAGRIQGLKFSKKTN